MTTPDALERDLTLRSAAARLEQLRMRSALAGLEEDGGPGLSAAEALEALALAEVLVRKATYGRPLDVRAAGVAGASWAQIGAACGTTRQAAWEAHDRWISGQAALHEQHEIRGLDDEQAREARRTAGSPAD